MRNLVFGGSLEALIAVVYFWLQPLLMAGQLPTDVYMDVSGFVPSWEDYFPPMSKVSFLTAVELIVLISIDSRPPDRHP